jgi:glycosyltransferase involved in cell wall biosynthesis
MRIGLDARFLTHPQPGGYKSYIGNLAPALVQVDDENEYVLYTDRPASAGLLPDARNVRLRPLPGTLPLVGVPLREQFLLPLGMMRDRVDVMHSPFPTAPVATRCPFVLTVYDTIWRSAPPFSRRSPRRLAMWLYTRALPMLVVRRARAVLTISRSAKEEIVHNLGLPEERVHVVYPAAAPLYRALDDVQEQERVRRTFGLDAHFILAIGSADPRKNVPRLIEAYARLGADLRRRHALVIVWTHALLQGRAAALVEELGVQDRVHFLQGVSDEDLARLYRSAALFVFPSLYEGFGLPPLEAMACGTPVVAADNSSIPEAVGDAAVQVDSRDVEALACAMARVLGDGELREELRARGLARARTFSWERCARETLAVYRSVGEGEPPQADGGGVEGCRSRL